MQFNNNVGWVNRMVSLCGVYRKSAKPVAAIAAIVIFFLCRGKEIKRNEK